LRALGVWGPSRGPHLSWRAARVSRAAPSVGGGPFRGPPYSIGEVGRQPRTLGDGQHHLARLTLAHDGDLHALPDAQRLHARDVLRMAADRGAVDLGEDVTAQQVLLALDDHREVAPAHPRAVGGRAVVDD